MKTILAVTLRVLFCPLPSFGQAAISEFGHNPGLRSEKKIQASFVKLKPIARCPPMSPLHSPWSSRRVAEIPDELLESHVSDMLVVLEVVEAGDLLASNRDIIECQVQDLRIR